MFAIECCCCFREGPRSNKLWGYQVEDAYQQGFRNITMGFWLANDPNRPTEWDQFNKWEPGTISVYSKFCESCLQHMTLRKCFDLIYSFSIRHDYRHYGGAGGQGSMTRRHDGICDVYTICCNCRREILDRPYSISYQQGWILVGMDEHRNQPYYGHLSVCPNCINKLTMNKMKSLDHEWYAIAEAKYQEDYAKTRAIEQEYYAKVASGEVVVPKENVSEVF